MNVMLVKVFLVYLVLGVFAASTNADCVLPLPRFRFFAPLIFSSDGQLLPTDNQNEHALKITVPSNKQLILSCAPNYFNASLNASKWLSASCKSGEEFEIDGVNYNWLSDLSCEVRPVEETIKPISGCPRNATSVEFGYENPVKHETQIIGEACYSEERGTSIFVHTRFTKGRGKTVALIETESPNYLARNHPESKYKIDFLVAARLDELNVRLEKLLGTKKVPFLEHRHFIDLSILQNGQLNSALKLGWNFVLTSGFDHLPNYDLLLKDIMSISESQFDLYLGTHSVLSLNAGERKVGVYLLPDEGKYPVPKYLWAVVVKASGSATGFLISNDIDAKDHELIEDAPCDSRCSQIPWLDNVLENDSYKKPKNGYVFCCNLERFMQAVPEMPALEGRFKMPTSNEKFEDEIELI